MIELIGCIDIPQKLYDHVYNTEPNRYRNSLNVDAKEKTQKANLKLKEFYGDHNCWSVSWTDNWYKDIVPQSILDKLDVGYPLSAVVRKQNPGNFVPPHRDTFKSLFFEQDPSAKPNDVLRMWIPLEDYQFGQVFFVEDQVFYNWKAGDVYVFPAYAYHSSANAGEHPRHVLLINCKKLYSKEEK